MSGSHLSLARGHVDSVTALALSDCFLASGGEDGNTYLWSLNEGPYPILQTPRLDPCTSLKFSSRKPDILYSAHGRQIFSWDTRHLRVPLNEWMVNEDEINSIDLLDEDLRLSSADDSGAVQVVDTNTGTVVRTLKKHENICSTAKFRPNRKWQLISGGLDCRIVVSDWKGSGLGVIIFEMDEIVDSVTDDSAVNHPDQSFHLDDSDVNSDDDAEVECNEISETDKDIENETLPDHFDEAFEAQSLMNVEHSPSSGLGSGADGENSTSDGEYAYPEDQENSTTDSGATLLTSGPGAWRSGLPINPPMVHTLVCSYSGDFVAAGLESSTIELFAGKGKRLAHQESLYGHTRGVSALHFIGDSYLISGGNDRNLFVWTFGSEVTGHHIFHGEKVSAIEGKSLDRIFVADFSPVIQVLDLSVH